MAFKRNNDGKLIWQYNFKRPNGEGPYAGLLRDSAGNLFGITELGGDNGCYPGYGCGTRYAYETMPQKPSSRARRKGRMSLQPNPRVLDISRSEESNS